MAVFIKFFMPVVWLFIPLFSYPQIKPAKKADSIKTTIISQPSNNESQAYKLLYETAQKSYENQKETEHWFIGTTILFIIFILGSQVYFNFRFNQQTINEVTSEFDEKLADTRSEQLQRLGEQKSEITNNMLKLFKDANQISHQIGKKLDEEMSDKFASAEKYNNAVFERIKVEQQNSILSTEIKFRHTSGLMYLSTNNYLQGLLEFLDAMKLEIDSKLDIGNSLFGILRCLYGLKDLRLENKLRLEEYIGIIKSSGDETSNLIINLIEEKIKELKIWTIDTKDNVMKDGSGNPINTLD